MPARAKSLRMTTSRINRRNPDVIDDAAAAGMQIYGDIWALPSWVLEKTVSTALAAKDAVKHHVTKILKNSVTWEGDSDLRKDLVFSAQRARNVAELARIYQAGKAKGYSDVMSAVEERAKNLGLSMAKIKSPESTGWGWNPATLKNMTFAYKKNGKGRKNPEAAAAHFYQKFHGRPSEEEIVVEQEVHEHDWLGVIGTLQCVAILTPRGEEAEIFFDSGGSDPAPWLCSSEDGCQMYIVGGNQKIDLEALGLDGHFVKDRMILGQFAPPMCSECGTVIEKRGEELTAKTCKACGHKFVTFEDVDDYDKEEDRTWNLGYEAEKDFDNFERTTYLHDLGAPDEGSTKRKAMPTLEYDPINEQLFISGGEYHIELPVFGTSPGIEN